MQSKALETVACLDNDSYHGNYGKYGFGYNFMKNNRRDFQFEAYERSLSLVFR